ncbi:cold shock domain-containing protein [Halpernia frigidisoli]|uniref:Cold shock protein, CspA family n=1 Tax=Halpernia frigidisoli TaxID=1125876 RepID=A0A1I3DMK5_9FLAO|nr:cold shock domain-containing protein [Halpernia frigidisoli]SFH87972.1 Cold shock protein, CspA family [Halpernia frigidisoli]
MADSFTKKEGIKKKIQKQKEKEARREERKDSNDKGKTLDDMIMYVDAYGQLTSTPPDKNIKVDFDLDDIQLGAAKIEPEETLKVGTVTFLSEKGYGFITEEKSKENVFFHENNCTEQIKKGNRVSFEVEKSPKGFSAVDIKIVK